jgi:hypothetical protein
MVLKLKFYIACNTHDWNYLILILNAWADT